MVLGAIRGSDPAERPLTKPMRAGGYAARPSHDALRGTRMA